MVRKRDRRGKFIKQGNLVSDDIFIPNHSGEHTAGTTGTPTEDRQIANKAYVDTEILTCWLKSLGQTGLTGDKSGSFNLTTTGIITGEQLNIFPASGTAGGIEIWENDGGNIAFEMKAGTSAGQFLCKLNGITTIRLHGSTGVSTYFNAGDVGIGLTDPDSRLHIEDSSFPVLKTVRTGTGDSGIRSSYVLKTKTSNATMINGFGGGIVFAIEDASSGEKSIAGVKGYRDGGDGIGGLRLQVGDGGADDGILIEADKTVVMDKTSGVGIKVDTVTPTFGFRDIIGDQFSKNTGATKPTLTAYNGVINSWLFGVGDEAYITYHVPHDYVAGTPVFLHTHWSHIGDFVTGGTVTFKLTSISAKAHNQAPFNSTPKVGTYTGTASTVKYQQILSEVLYSDGTPTGLEIDTATLEPDSVIELTFEVDANDLTVSEGLVPDIFVHYVDIHYQSTNIATKDKAPDFYA